jgi:hypothetical protein
MPRTPTTAPHSTTASRKEPLLLLRTQYHFYRAGGDRTHSQSPALLLLLPLLPPRPCPRPRDRRHGNNNDDNNKDDNNDGNDNDNKRMTKTATKMTKQ